MKKRILTTLVLVIAFNVRGQISHLRDTYSVSLYSDYNLSKGVELRGNFNSWYVAFQRERFTFNNKSHLNWGGSVGVAKEWKHNISLFAGGRLGFVRVENTSLRPSYGIESEVNYYLSRCIFLGVRGSLDFYMDSTIQEIGTQNYSRVFLKIGYTF